MPLDGLTRPLFNRSDFTAKQERSQAEILLSLKKRRLSQDHSRSAGDFNAPARVKGPQLDHLADQIIEQCRVVIQSVQPATSHATLAPVAGETERVAKEL